jgi:ribosomal protein L10
MLVVLDLTEDEAESVLLTEKVLEMMPLLLKEEVVAKLLDVAEVLKLLEGTVLLVLLNENVVEGTRVADEVLKLLINEDKEERASVLLEGENVLVLLEEDVSMLLDDEKLLVLLDSEAVAALLNDEELVPVVPNDEELVSILLEEEEGEELAVPEVLALLLNKLIVPVLVDRVLGSELLPLLLVIEELSVVLENVLHGGPVVNVLVNVAVTNEVVVCIFLVWHSKRLTKLTYRTDQGKRCCSQAKIRFAQTSTPVITCVANACDRTRYRTKSRRCGGRLRRRILTGIESIDSKLNGRGSNS